MNKLLNNIYFGTYADMFDQVSDETIDLIIADPPYGKDKANWDEEIPIKWLHGAYRMLTEKGTLYVFAPLLGGEIVLDKAKELGFKHINTLIWYYENGMSRQTKTFCIEYDPIYMFAKTTTPIFNLDDLRVPYKSVERLKNKITKGGRTWTPNPFGKKRGNVLRVPALAGNRFKQERTAHPTQKPEALIKILIKASCPPNGIVLDPFMGSGTTAVAAQKLGRTWTGAERKQEYRDIALKRLAQELLF